MKRSAVLLLFVLFALAVLIAPVSAQDINVTELASPILPWDATISPDAATVYYTAIDANGTPAVFSVPAAGGDATVLAGGAPLVMPLGIDVSSDGQTLYIADPWLAGVNGNAIFALAADGASMPRVVVGTQGTAPQGVTVSGDQIYFSGIEPATGQPAIYRISASGAGDATILAQGAPLNAPAGLAIAKDGTVYVLDRLASGSGLGSVLRIQGGTVDSIASDIRTGGQMPGVALTLDESTLLVSSLDSATGTAQALVINLGTMETGIFNNGIGKNTGAGGLHRAHESDNFAWADCNAPDRSGNGGGHVYLLGITASPINK